MEPENIIRNLPALLCGAFAGVLFIQSGLDKVFDWSGNLAFLKDHFSATFVAGMVPVMLATVTLMELATGFMAAGGVIYLLVTGSSTLLFYAAVVGALSILSLFFGQRIAKDYPGAAVLVPYFILMIILMILTSPGSIR